MIEDDGGHLVPAVFLFLFTDAGEELLFALCGFDGCEPADGICDGRFVDLANIAYLSVRHDLRESADIGDEHGLLEMVGDLRHAALGGGLVRLDDEVRRREIVPYLIIGDEIRPPDDGAFQLKLFLQVAVLLAVVVELTGDNENGLVWMFDV